jgi:hypothetical protein
MSGVRQQNVFSLRQVGTYNTDFHVTRTTKPVMYGGVSEIAPSLAL